MSLFHTVSFTSVPLYVSPKTGSLPDISPEFGRVLYASHLRSIAELRVLKSTTDSESTKFRLNQRLTYALTMSPDNLKRLTLVSKACPESD